MNPVVLWIAEAGPVLFAALFGAVFASFCCVVVERVPRHESLNGRSHCVCGRQLRAWENVPVLGWVLSGGRARCCGARIPAHYVLAEVVAVVVWGALVALLGAWGLAVAAVLTAVVTTVATRRGVRSARSAG